MKAGIGRSGAKAISNGLASWCLRLQATRASLHHWSLRKTTKPGRDQRVRLTADRWIVAEADEPRDLGLTTEPRHLTLRIIAMALLGGGDGLMETEFAAQALQRLLIAQ